MSCVSLEDNAACNCLCLLNAKDKNESEICNYSGYSTDLSLLLSCIEPVSARTAQCPATQAPTHKQVCIAAENICSLYQGRSIR